MEMHLRSIVSVFLVLSVSVAVLATDSRVQTMGRTDHFFMDDISIFRNSANLNVYPNMLMGSLGTYKYDSTLDKKYNAAGQAESYDALQLRNRDPQRPYFGGIFSFSLNQSTDAGDQYPMLSLGGVLNRHDEMLDYIIPGTRNFAGSSKVIMEEPLGKIDLMGSYAFKGGLMVGVGGYMAFQKVNKGSETVDMESSLYKVNVGVNWPISKTMDMEVSFGGAQLTGIGKLPTVDTLNKTLPSEVIVYDTIREVIAQNDNSYKLDWRLFSALSKVNGDLVPHIGLEIRNLNQDIRKITNVNGGLGLNLNIDRGFFWAGAEMIYQESALSKQDATVFARNPGLRDEVWQRYGGKVSLGIERNIIWDWFVWRVGCTKQLLYESRGENTGRWIQNPEADASDQDHVAFGVALNIENRLKIDGVIAEDIFYTFTNLFSGNDHHLFTNITVTYSF
jgi:hypothetical protein